VNTHNQRTLVALASLFATTVVVVAGTLVASSAWWSSSSPRPERSAAASRPTASTSFPSASKAPSPSTDRPQPIGTPSASTIASKELTQVPAPEPRTVAVVTSFAGWNATSSAVEVGGYAAVVERAGTCTLRLIHGNQVVIRTQTANGDATTVACGSFHVSRAALTVGAWRVVLAYTSSTSTGEAAAVTIEVP
jgi:hypothetical protein